MDLINFNTTPKATYQNFYGFILVRKSKRLTAHHFHPTTSKFNMKNLVKVVLFTFMVMSIQTGYSQEAARLEKRVKLYMNGQYQNWNNSFDFGRITPAFQMFNRKGNFHELELNQFSIIKNTMTWPQPSTRVQTGDVRYNLFDFSFRYEYGIQWLKNKNLGRFKLYTGIGINPRYSFSRINPESSIAFSQKSNILELSAQIVPRISYKLTERIDLDLNMPFNFGTFLINRSVSSNPNLANARQLYTQTNFSVPTDQLQFRLGLTFKF